jgi:hypothetical protein
MPDAPGLRDDAVALRLENLEALTDTTLTRLDVDDLLVELLGRVREILDVDTAAVLMLDADSEVLVARAACGIEDEVRQGVRIPLGTGFAGRIAATKQPVRLDHVDATTVANPLLWEKGIKVMLGVPLMSGNDVLGVLHVGRLSNRSFGDEDITLLQVAADRIAGATQTRALAIERAATRLLERSLLPATLPRCPGLGFATRYVPAEERTVGGDWYDLFLAPPGQLWIVVGDVAGHGVQAAVLMERIRSALRAYALLDTSPAHVLDLVDPPRCDISRSARARGRGHHATPRWPHHHDRRHRTSRDGPDPIQLSASASWMLRGGVCAVARSVLGLRSAPNSRRGRYPPPRRMGRYRRPMAHIRIGDKSWNVTDDAETVLRQLTSGETYMGDLTGGSGALVISSTLNWAVVSAKQPAVDPAASAF